ncbi:unnamed protein product [Linum trigynum]|uniref:Uncharacterized protein n=1 Tax=Linum trigynum TaxID=586398 RepID=A0AAV2ED91_9ROSI
MAAAVAATNWVVEVNEQLKLMADASAEEEHWKKQSIYRLPACVTDLNKTAYRPQAVSFGPYHHGEDHLLPMEEHKQRALLHFLRRSNKPLQLFVDAIAEVVASLKESYNPLEAPWIDEEDATATASSSKFVRLMIVDGCFMLEVLRVATHTLDDYAQSDPIFSTHGRIYLMPYIKRDMMMLENQLPMLLLDKLLAVECGDACKDEEYVNKLILKFCLPNTPVINLGKCLHVVDVYRKCLIHQDDEALGIRRRRRQRPTRGSAFSEAGDDIVRSAMELNEAGIRFKKSSTGSPRDITFKGGVLKLPVIEVDDFTESIYLNLIAYERFHVGAGNEVTSYIFFMDKIIDDQRDVALLVSNGIIQNALGSDKAVAKLFNSLSRDTALDPESSLDVVHKRVNAYCKKAWNEWRANLIHTYFRSPWAILSLVAAFFLFALTIASTIYTIYPYYYPRDDSEPPQSSLPPMLSPKSL